MRRDLLLLLFFLPFRSRHCRRIKDTLRACSVQDGGRSMNSALAPNKYPCTLQACLSAVVAQWFVDKVTLGGSYLSLVNTNHHAHNIRLSIEANSKITTYSINYLAFRPLPLSSSHKPNIRTPPDLNHHSRSVNLKCV